jgi:hypothetical protein
MKRVLLLIPEGLTFDMLSIEQQAAINSVFGQYANPMPSTIPANRMQIVDAVTADNFDPAVMPQYGIDWPVIGLFQWDGKSPEITTLQELKLDVYIQHLPNDVTYDENGKEVSSTPTTVHEAHTWAGWPNCIEVTQ